MPRGHADLLTSWTTLQEGIASVASASLKITGFVFYDFGLCAESGNCSCWRVPIDIGSETKKIQSY